MIATYRDDDAGDHNPLRAVLPELLRDHGALRLKLAARRPRRVVIERMSGRAVEFRRAVRGIG